MMTELIIGAGVGALITLRAGAHTRRPTRLPRIPKIRRYRTDAGWPTSSPASRTRAASRRPRVPARGGRTPS
jgi:hypothetical protein